MTKLSLKAKLTVSIGTILTFACALGVFALVSASEFRQSLNLVSGSVLRKMELIGSISTAKSDMVKAQRGVIAFAYGNIPSGVERSQKQFTEAVESFKQSLEELSGLVTNPQAVKQVARLRDILRQWLPEYEKLEKLCQENRPQEALELANSIILPLYNDANAATVVLADIQRQNAESEAKKAETLYHKDILVTGGLLVVSLVIGAFVLFLVRSTVKSLQNASNQTTQGATFLASVAHQILSSSQNLASGASQQAASLEQVSASSEEISSMTKGNTDNVQAMAGLVRESLPIVGKVSAAHGELSGAISRIAESSHKISKIIKVIDEIAFQTNILALNASVEAARAGEAGLGFSVVADEVRSLALRCAQAAKDTDALIGESVAHSAEGQLKLGLVLEAMNENNRIVQQLGSHVEGINAASQQQLSGITEVAKAIVQMQQVTQHIAASSEECAAASAELDSQAESLQQTASVLNTLIQ
jgi:methyl-accepting chemotaxis protein/methyl-accepting chemotaxis protein-1 (serine sensor receptor)